MTYLCEPQGLKDADEVGRPAVHLVADARVGLPGRDALRDGEAGRDPLVPRDAGVEPDLERLLVLVRHVSAGTLERDLIVREFPPGWS